MCVCVRLDWLCISVVCVSEMISFHCFLSNDIELSNPLKLTPASPSAASNSRNSTADVLIVDFAYFNCCLVIASGKQCVLIVLQSYLDERLALACRSIVTN